MKPISRLLIAASAIALTAAPRAWSAPDAPLTAAPQAQVAQAAAEIKNETIQLKNVPPSWMAHTLMVKPPAPPDTSALPAGSVIAFWVQNGVEMRIRKGTPEGDKFEAAQKARAEATRRNPIGLPDGIESLTPNDATGTLQVRGAAQDVALLHAIIEILDKPLRKVELEVRTVRINKADMKEFDVNMTSMNHPSLGFVRQDYRAPLQKLLDANRASTIMDVRATSANNVGGTYSSGALDQVASPFGQGMSLVGQAAPVPKIELQLVPTINNDDTITVSIRRATTMPSQSTAQPSTNTVANVRDGDTILLGDLDVQESEQATVTFLTARIVKKADEKK